MANHRSGLDLCEIVGLRVLRAEGGKKRDRRGEGERRCAKVVKLSMEGCGIRVGLSKAVIVYRVT
jgi:hypothetical protein